MINLERLVNDIFEDEKLYDYNLRSFTEDHLIRLSLPANNPGGIYAPVIASTTTKYSNFFGKITNEITKKAISEGLTASMDAAKTAALAETSLFEKLVTYKFSANIGIYDQFYPQGLSEYHNATIGQLTSLFARLLNAANTNMLVSNPVEVGLLQTKIDAFINARIAQEIAFAEVDNLQTGRREDRQLLTLQLTTNMLTIALNNLLNPDNFNNYYNPSYLPLTEGSLNISGIINANAIATAVNEGIITSSSNITVYNEGIDDLIFGLNDQAAILNPLYQRSIQAGNHITYTEQLPVFTKYYLNVLNTSPSNNGKWKVTIR